MGTSHTGRNIDQSKIIIAIIAVTMKNIKIKE